MIQQDRLTFRDIQTTEVFFYDPVFSKKGFAFCQKRDIDCLPSLDDPTLFYRRDDELRDFAPEELTATRCVPAYQTVFNPDLLEQFRANPVLFVFDDDELSGVVHFADYNKPIVSDFLYTRLAAYERNLRQLSILSGLSDVNMGTYFREKVEERQAAQKDASYFEQRRKAYERQKDSHSQTPPFQLFYLDDLLGLLKPIPSPKNGVNRAIV